MKQVLNKLINNQQKITRKIVTDLLTQNDFSDILLKIEVLSGDISSIYTNHITVSTPIYLSAYVFDNIEYWLDASSNYDVVRFSTNDLPEYLACNSYGCIYGTTTQPASGIAVITVTSKDAKNENIILNYNFISRYSKTIDVVSPVTLTGYVNEDFIDMTLVATVSDATIPNFELISPLPAGLSFLEFGQFMGTPTNSEIGQMIIRVYADNCADQFIQVNYSFMTHQQTATIIVKVVNSNLTEIQPIISGVLGGYWASLYLNIQVSDGGTPTVTSNDMPNIFNLNTGGPGTHEITWQGQTPSSLSGTFHINVSYQGAQSQNLEIQYVFIDYGSVNVQNAGTMEANGGMYCCGEKNGKPTFQGGINYMEWKDADGIIWPRGWYIFNLFGQHNFEDAYYACNAQTLEDINTATWIKLAGEDPVPTVTWTPVINN